MGTGCGKGSIILLVVASYRNGVQLSPYVRKSETCHFCNLLLSS